MAGSFFFYDLETSGISPRKDRVMQFGGQRTDLKLKPIGDPINAFIKLTPDVVPDPFAILLTGITPQKSLAEGISEAEFLKLFYEQAVQSDTTFVGFNSIRFDDEFMRFFNYRNFYDAYEWQWRDGCSRWDLLDVIRMMRALRPDGIKWPFATDGKPTNRLEFLTKINKLPHTNAHDALGDVLATIEVAKLVRAKQPELFDYLYSMRGKKAVAKLVEAANPFVYTSGHYPSASLHTTVVSRLSDHFQPDAALVYDLRHDPTPFIKMNVDQLVETWRYNKDPQALRLPVRTLKYNRCPAIAPLGVIKDTATQERIGLTLETINANLKILNLHKKDFVKKLLQAVERLDVEQQQRQAHLIDDPLTVDERLYDSFISDADRQIMRAVRAAQPEDISQLASSLKDPRLKNLLPLYKARNYPGSLSSSEYAIWDDFCRKRLSHGGPASALAQYFAKIEELAGQPNLSSEKQYLLEELRLYGQSIVPGEA